MMIIAWDGDDAEKTFVISPDKWFCPTTVVVTVVFPPSGAHGGVGRGGRGGGPL